jgi:hypothetical protein
VILNEMPFEYDEHFFSTLKKNDVNARSVGVRK